MTPTLLWFRNDLRLADHPALAAALARGGPIVPVYIFDPAADGAWPRGAASRWWLHHALASLGAEIGRRGGRLILRRGEALAVLQALSRETGATAVYWHRAYEPAAIARDTRLKSTLQADGLEVRSFNTALLFEPTRVANRSGEPFKVFTPFWRHCLTLEVEAPTPVPLSAWPAPSVWPASEPLEQWSLRPRRGWDQGFMPAGWQPGEAGAQQRLRRFVAERLDAYAEARDCPAVAGTSGLSPHLHFGELSPRQVWAALRARGRITGVFPASQGEMRFLTELGWREFARHLLYHYPDTPQAPWRPDFQRFPWAEDPDGSRLRAWQQGRTGYPIVDAGLRELWATGWMHNRVRMIAASFLVKHLRLPWQSGAAWFWDTLVDADLAGNTLGWQWSAGCGADAAPYFRIFNPVLQGRKFDAEGAYVRRWVPELARVSNEWIHAPWEAPAAELARAGVRLGEHYPRPMVEHARARAEALAAWSQFSRAVGAPPPPRPGEKGDV